MSKMKDFFYDTVIAPTEFRAPTTEERRIKQEAWNKTIGKQLLAEQENKYPKGSNQDEMYNMEKEYWVNVAQQDRFNPNKAVDAINPSHYKGIIADYQYIECMEYILGVEGLKAHLKGQGYKYLMRMGKKDEEMQELKKALWYFKCFNILLRDGTIIGKLNELK